MRTIRLHIIRLFAFLFLLMAGGTANEAWAYKVTYHVLTLPIDNTTANMVSEVNGKRLEAVRAIVDNATEIRLPDHFKSPLATNFRYYKADQVEKSAATNLHSGSDRVKGIIYYIKGELTQITTDDETPVTEGTAVDANMDIYVTYDYVGNSNSIVNLNGDVIYNIGVKKGFLAMNRGRSNRPAVVPRNMVPSEQLTSEDFVKLNVDGSGISTYWNSNDNKNPRASIESQFHFLFKLEGNDPYNIIIRTAYSKDSTYMEKESDNTLHFKYYKESSIFTPSTNNAYLASDEHRAYNKVFTNTTDYPTIASFPTNLTEGEGNGWTSSPGFFHRANAPIWSTFALLNNTTGDGYVFMGSRTYNNDGSFSNPGGSNNNYQYKYLKFDNNNLTINNQTPANATTNYSVDQKFYEIKTVTFKVVTPFGHTVSASVKMSEYKILNDDISTDDIPTELKRKYCTFTTFYDDAAHNTQITKYSQMTGNDIYLGYEVQNAPFQAITPGSYNADTWRNATWYELTDESSTEENGKKLKYDGTTNFKNNGAHNEYAKTSEYAFIGDPYELRVVLRSATSGSTPSYVGATGTPTTGTAFTASTSATAGYNWEIPYDATDGSFLLRLYDGTGHWNWTVGNRSEAVTYGTDRIVDDALSSNAQTVTFNISGLTVADGNYIKVTKGGTDAAQVTATTPALIDGIGGVASDGTATVTATIAANSSGANKSFTLTVTEYNKSNAVVGTATTITVTQSATAFAGNTVKYSTTASTRVKVLEMTNGTYTYKIVDRAGRIAVKASTTQPIYSPLSIATIPSIIVSPFIADETVTFYSTYTGGGRGNLSDEITEAPEITDPEVGVDIYVKYTTTNLDSKPFSLSEDQEIFVRLNGRYLYYDAVTGTIKSAGTSTNNDNYKWKLRNRDPYAMLLDNLGARTALNVSGSESVTVPTNDDGASGSQTRQMGAWVKLAAAAGNDVALTFNEVRANAQPFIAKSSARTGVYEVMVATGDDVDAGTTYYNIGCYDENTVKIYSNATYQAGVADEIKFRLEENQTYVYHLIDKAKHELLYVESKSPELVLPAEYQSPLVGAANYSYYDIDQFTVSGEGANAVYTLKNSPMALTNISSLLATYNTTPSNEATYTAADENNKMEVSTTDDMNSEAKKLPATGHYYFKVGSDYYDVDVTKPWYHDIYVTYEKNNLVTFNNPGHPYMLKFLDPAIPKYYLEDGNDNLTETAIQPIYPYCNGDGNLNIYGAAMNEEQMNGGANTRPRWIWYFDNPGGSTGTYADDPYHVTIRSKSTITYNDVSHYTYLTTYAVHFNQDADANTKHIVTRGALPSIASEDPTEYMILGTQGNYRLMTTNEINDGITNERRSVTSFEQYWKTYNMVKLVVLKISKETNTFSEDPTTFVVPDDKRSELLIAQPNWHSYDAWANATRWNGYNNKEEDGVGKKVAEKLEHWFQTFDMGTGAFDIESADIPPVLVLLDRHGWEIMRKPLPTKSTYPNGDELDALRAYDSPMVKEYKFYNNATKASGCHKYSLRTQNGTLRDEIKVSGTAYTSTSLAALPPINATGVTDNAGFIQDFYVTYTVKEEYEKSYDPSTDTRSKFLVLQNGRFLKKKNNETQSYISKPIYEHTNPTGGNVYDLILSPRNNTVDILENGKIADYNFWYVGPNTAIDTEMGYPGTAITYTDAEKGFDPYNMQIKNVGENKYLTSNMTSSTRDGGAMVGGYTTDGVITMEDATTSTISSEGYDHSTLAITNQTFMAVQDVNGNMQLMPRFDHTKRINTSKASPYLTTLEDPVDHTVATADNNSSMGSQTTFLVRPQIMEYLIIDNQGREALRYKRAGEYFPTITEHFKSPMATNFKFYKTAPTYNSETKTLTVTDEITGSFADKEMNGDDETVYVRYSYNESLDSDGEQILQGKWFTIKLNNLDVQASGPINTSDGTGVSLLQGESKPTTIDADDKTWQWKFLKAPTAPTSDYYTAPDPYAIELYNRHANYSTTLGASSPMSVPIKVNGKDRFSLLSHPDGGYALAVNGLGTYIYSFLNGASMTSSVAATTTAESTDNSAANHFTIKSNVLSPGAQLIINDDVTHNYTYKVINNAGTLAVSATQDDAAAAAHSYAPYLPDAAQTPLLNDETDYLYYGSVSSGTYNVVDETELITLYGLYDDEVYVRYKAFDRDKTPYHVPNVRNSTGTGTVAIDGASNDVAFDLSGNLPYNIIWLSDNMMSSDGTTISDGRSHALDGNDTYVWKFENNDPYAIHIRHKGDEGNYVDGTTTLNAAPKPFMLLKKEGYDYGVLQETGDVKKLTGYGGALTADGSTAPTKFIPFALSVHKLIYHLVINNTGSSTTIPYREGTEDSYKDSGWKSYAEASPNTETIPGTTQRNLSTHPIEDVDAGQVSLGDVLEEPSTFYRPNCNFDYYIEGVYNDNECNTPNGNLNNRFKGLKINKLMSDADLIGTTVKVNVTYGFTQGLETNAGDGFVTSTDQNLWYTYEAKAATPKLAQYTGSLQTVSGYATHYTNDYLWTPLGDPYGFKMYNRYMHKNLSQTTTVMTTTAIADNQAIEMRSDNDANSVYELLADGLTTAGYFYVHPVANSTGTQYYMRDNDGTVQLSTTRTEWTYGLSEDVMRPYYEGAGYVGGLNAAGKAAYEKALADYNTPEETFTKLVMLQDVVYNHDKADDDQDNYIVHYTPGYYRLHNQPGSESLSTLRYASGYLHDIEKTAGESSTAIPMHFYSRAGINGTFEGESYPLGTGFTKTVATQGDIPIPATEYDPSSIFFFSGSSGSINISTQGLNVLENKMTTSTGTAFTITDIGGAIIALSNSTNYLCYKQDGNIYDLKFASYPSMESARWCMQPVANLGLKVTMNDGGDGYYYSTFYAPFDVLLPDGESYAYVCTEWNTAGVHPVKVPAVAETYAEGKFVPARTPVIFRTTDTSGIMTLSLPSSSPSSPLSSCIFSGQYLEQMLAADATHDVYTFGLPFTSNVEINRADGSITAPAPEQAETGVGFYINANRNKEADPLESRWNRNNRYVLHNKIYYRAPSGNHASQRKMMFEYVPVDFDGENMEEEEEEATMNRQREGDGRVYDLQGRCVATEQQLRDGTWHGRLTPGIYIVNGRKVRIR